MILQQNTALKNWYIEHENFGKILESGHLSFDK